MMRQLTESELKTRDIAWLECLGNRRERGVDLDFFESGFIAGLDHTAERIAALTAERDALAQQLKIAEEVESYLGDKLQEEKQLGANQREVNAHLARERKKAEAENDALREALEKMR